MPASGRVPVGGGEEHLAERRLGVGGLLADHRVVDRDVAPAEHLQALAGGDLLDAGHGGGLGLRVAGQEGDAGGVGAGRREVEVDDRAEEASGTWMRMPAPSPTFASALVAPRWSRLQSDAGRARPCGASGGRAGRRRRRRRRRRARSAGRRGLAWWAASDVHPVSGGSESRSRALRWDDVGPLQVVRLYRSRRVRPTVTIRSGGGGRRVGGPTQEADGERGLRRGARAARAGRGRRRRIRAEADRYRRQREQEAELLVAKARRLLAVAEQQAASSASRCRGAGHRPRRRRIRRASASTCARRPASTPTAGVADRPRPHARRPSPGPSSASSASGR